MKKLIVLGTGQAVCLHYQNTAFALTDGTDYVLIDGGGGRSILTSLTETNVDWQHLHIAFLSHEHTDHLLGMVWVVRYVAELMNWHRYEGTFTVYGNDVALQKLETVCRLLLKKAQTDLLGERIFFREVQDGDCVEMLGDRVIFFDIHSRKAKQFGFLDEMREGCRLVFLGDEPFSEKCAKYLYDCDWLLSEAYCLYAERERYNPYELFHSTVKEPCEVAERFHVKNLVLWHTEDESTFGCRKEKYTAEARQFFSGNIFVPDDQEVLDICD